MVDDPSSTMIFTHWRNNNNLIYKIQCNDDFRRFKYDPEAVEDDKHPRQRPIW